MEAADAAAPIPAGEAEWLVSIGAARRQGDHLRAYDLAVRALQIWPDSIVLNHQAILALANAGAPGNARMRYDRLAATADLGSISARTLAEDIAALDGRLWKDLARRSRPVDALRYRLMSANAYASGYRRFGGYYSAINAASMFLAAGNKDDALEYAGAALELARREPSNYWAAATRAEALIILGDTPGATKALKAASILGAQKLDELAATRRQLAWVAELAQAPTEILQALVKPRVVAWISHSDGVVSNPGSQFSPDERVIAFGPVLSSADIMTAKAFLDAGVAVNLVLPCDPELIRSSSLCTSAGGLDEIFKTTIDRAASITLVTHEGGPFEPAARLLCHQQARGLAHLRAYSLAVAPELFPLAEGTSAFDSIPTDSAESDLIAEVPANLIRQPRAVLFGDVRGFSKLNEAQQLLFLTHIIGGFADVLDAYPRVEYAETAGDGLFVVVADIVEAVECCFALLEVLLPEKVAAASLPAHLGFRLSAHIGPLYRRYDRVIRRDKFCGMEVIRTARIEPVTPVGQIFVTEQFAATLACAAGNSYVCEYVGVQPMAKEFGECRMYSLRRAMS